LCIDFSRLATVTICNVTANFIYHGAVAVGWSNGYAGGTVAVGSGNPHALPQLSGPLLRGIPSIEGFDGGMVCALYVFQKTERLRRLQFGPIKDGDFVASFLVRHSTAEVATSRDCERSALHCNGGEQRMLPVR
jgi:hypothetical protein